MKSKMRIPRLLAALALCASALPNAIAYSGRAEPPVIARENQDSPPSRAQIEALILELEASTDDDEAARKDAVGLYRQALTALEQGAELRARALELERASGEAPALLESIRAELASPPQEPVVRPPSGSTLSALQVLQAQAEGELEVARKQFADIQAETASRAERRSVLPEEIARVRGELESAESILRAAVPDAASPPGSLERATRVLRLALLDSMRTRLRVLQSELDSYEARKELLPARRDQVARRVSQAQALANAWATLIGERRRTEAAEAQDRTSELRRSVLERLPDSEELGALSEAIKALAALRSGKDGPASRLESSRTGLVQLRSDLDDLRSRYQRTRSKVRVAGLTGAMGRILRSQYESLPEPAELERTNRRYQEELSHSHLQQILLEEERDQIADVERELVLLMAEVAPPVAERAELEQVARELLIARLGLTDGLLQDYTLYLDLLQELVQLSGTRFALVSEVRTYIEERILWVKSVESESMLGYLPRLSDAGAGLAWILDPKEWTDAWLDHRASTADRVRSFALVLVIVGLFAVRRPCRKRITKIAALVSRHRTDSFKLTLRGLLLSAIVAAPIPAALAAVGWLLGWLTDGREIVLATMKASWETAATLFPLYFLLALLLPKGLAEGHFRWPGGSVTSLRRSLRAALPFLIVFLLLFGIFTAQATESWHVSLGRSGFMGAMLVVAVVAYRTLSPRAKVLSEYLRRNEGSLLERTRLLWYPATFLVPLALVGLALCGYYYTAVQLYERFQATVGVALALLFVNALLLRWLFSTRRQLAVDQAQQRAQARRKALEADGEEEALLSPAEEEQVDIPTLDAQTRQLFRNAMIVAVAVGIYLIWAATLPALKGLDRVTVYPRFEVLSVEALESQGTAVTTPVEGSNGGPSEPATAGRSIIPVPSVAQLQSAPVGSSDAKLVVTLADLILSILVLVLTTIAAMNFPALLEIGLLQRLPIDAGARYAVTTVSRYVIAIVGISSAMGVLGISWSNIQWLAAALTFGLAFGLQEIFSNFVSGLIILMERPIRLGDIVTVGTIEGYVTRIRMRATTITDWDRRELLVPNREFITGQLINWTLSDPVTRLVIPVGIAYGSDTNLATKLLLKCASESPKVMKEPGPSAIFMTFGDSSLDLRLRAFIPRRDVYPEVVHDLHSRIDQEFRKAGIEIAFPQRDIHVRTAAGLEELTHLAPTRQGGRESISSG